MLKTVIQEKNVDGLLRFNPAALSEAVFARPKADAALQTEFHQLDFVARAICSPVAAAQNSDALLISEKFLREPNHHGCFASAANRQISDADHGCIQPFLLEPAVRIKPNARADPRAVKHGERPEQFPQ